VRNSDVYIIKRIVKKVLARFEELVRFIVMENIFKKRRIKQNTKKLIELILYISQSCESSRLFGLTKLNKMLFAIDFDTLDELGSPITGARYKKEDHGPVAYPLMPILKKLQESGDLEVREEKVSGKWQFRPVALRSADMSLFTDAEIEQINKWVNRMKGLTAVSLSRWSHKLSLWEMADDEDFIPYERIYWKMDQSHPIDEHDQSAVEEINQLRREGLLD